MGSGSGMMMSPQLANQITFSSVVLGSELNATVSDLTPFTDYACYVSANTSVGEGNLTTPVYETTDEFGKK